MNKKTIQGLIPKAMQAIKRPLKNKEMYERGILRIKGAKNLGGSKG